MTTRMLIDARHQEETRVAVVKGNKIEEFDFESADHKQIKGNIYLAKVTRVEPSLQAAFVEYGGNRHGFLAFSEIHPDYYQIPREDREKLLAEEAEHAAEEAALREQEEEEDDVPGALMRSEMVGDEDSDLIEVEKDESVDTIDMQEGQEPDLDDDTDDDNGDENGDSDDGDSEGNTNGNRGGPRRRGRGPRNTAKASDAARQKRMALRRRYKIQDVIQRRQVVLVQVVKEERGNKGAALTTYLSLAGRYCVLMPNTSHGGGISRKISSATDRKRLKSIIADLSLPASMGCIVRTAGLSRTKPEIKRDFDYLARLWDEIRENTLKATAPQLIHSDSDLIKRAIRDIYNRDITEVLVEGADGFRAAKDFMKLLMPSHARRVQSYSDPVSLFQRYGVEDQLSAMYQPEVQLPSGGYLVINPTEALVSIDINSGRSTKEHGIEATALKTNMEAANEIARQLRLRDMAGLVVIDFIDMDRHGNVRKVERALKEALKNDRARIQVGRISSFGLLEMSRQRLRTGVLEASTRVCPHCEGTGLVRTASSAGLSALRLIEEEAAKGKSSQITLRASQEAVIFVLNTKRSEISEIETRYGVSVEILPDGESEGAKMTVTGSGPPPQNAPVFVPIVDDDDIEIAEEIDDEQEEVEQEERPRKKRRRRGGRRNRNGRREEEGGNEEAEDNRDSADAPSDQDTGDAEGAPSAETVEAPQTESPKPKPRRRRGRGGAGAAKSAESAAVQDAADAGSELSPAPAADIPAETADDTPSPAGPKRAPRKRATKAQDVNPELNDADNGTSDAIAPEPEADKKPAAKKPAARKSTAKKPAPKVEPADAVTAPAEAEAEPDAAVTETSSEADTKTTSGPARKGWWQRTFG